MGCKSVNSSQYFTLNLKFVKGYIANFKTMGWGAWQLCEVRRIIISLIRRLVHNTYIYQNIPLYTLNVCNLWLLGALLNVKES